jgi:cyanophycin synthetase
VRLGPSTAAIVEEARRRGIPVRRLNARSLVQLGLGRHLRRIQATVTDFTSLIGAEVAQNKEDTRRVLAHVGLPAPQGGVARSPDEARALARRIGYPVILKPLNLNHGRGISDRLDTPEALDRAWEATSALVRDAGAASPRLIVETFAAGRDHRVLVVGGRVVACAERVPAHVVGDGARSLRALVAEANRDPRRGRGHAKVLTFLPCDGPPRSTSPAAASRSTRCRPRARPVFLRATANLSTGGTSIDRTDEMHPDNVTACEMAAGVVGLDVAGIDVLTPDISVPFRENGAVIIEVNAGPGIRMHTHPARGGRATSRRRSSTCSTSRGSPRRSRSIAVTGTNGKTTTTRLVAHLFRHTGVTVGFTTTDGIYLGNRLVIEGDMTGRGRPTSSSPTPRGRGGARDARGGLLARGSATTSATWAWCSTSRPTTSASAASTPSSSSPT